MQLNSKFQIFKFPISNCTITLRAVERFHQVLPTALELLQHFPAASRRLALLIGAAQVESAGAIAGGRPLWETTIVEGLAGADPNDAATAAAPGSGAAAAKLAANVIAIATAVIRILLKLLILLSPVKRSHAFISFPRNAAAVRRRGQIR